MNVPTFEYLHPDTLNEASSLLSQCGKKARLMAGGTDILVKMKQRRLVPPYLINLKGIPGLDYVRYEEGKGLHIGALASIESLKSSMIVRTRFPMLHQAAAYMATVEIRNRATLVGNICNGSPSAETAPALIALGAEAWIVGQAGKRSVAVEDFFVGPGSTALGPGELVAEVFVPEPPLGSGGAYDKYSLRRMDVAVVGAAALVIPNRGTAPASGPHAGAATGGSAGGAGSGRPGDPVTPAIIDDIRIVLSAVAPTPIRVRGAEAVLRGKSPSLALIEEAARAAAEESRPITDIRGSAELRKTMVPVMTTRVILQALRAAKLEVR